MGNINSTLQYKSLPGTYVRTYIRDRFIISLKIDQTKLTFKMFFKQKSRQIATAVKNFHCTVTMS